MGEFGERWISKYTEIHRNTAAGEDGRGWLVEVAAKCDVTESASCGSDEASLDRDMGFILLRENYYLPSLCLLFFVENRYTDNRAALPNRHQRDDRKPVPSLLRTIRNHLHRRVVLVALRETKKRRLETRDIRSLPLRRFPCYHYGLLFRGASCILFAVRRFIYFLSKRRGERATDELIASVGHPSRLGEGRMQMK